MTDKAWAEGMAEFQRVGMPGWPYDDPGISSERAQAYRRHLDSLSDGQWYHAVSTAIARCKWFPTVHELLDFGDNYTPAYKLLSARTSEERERDRDSADKGLEMIRQALGKAGVDVKRMPRRGTVVEATDERKAELLRQAKSLENAEAKA